MSDTVAETQVRQSALVSGVTGIRKSFEIVALILNGGYLETLSLFGESESAVELEAFGSGVTASVAWSTQVRQVSLVSGKVSTVGAYSVVQTRQRSVAYSFDVKGEVAEGQTRQTSSSQGGEIHGEISEGQVMQVSVIQGAV